MTLTFPSQHITQTHILYDLRIIVESGRNEYIFVCHSIYHYITYITIIIIITQYVRVPSQFRTCTFYFLCCCSRPWSDKTDMGAKKKLFVYALTNVKNHALIIYVFQTQLGVKQWQRNQGARRCSQYCVYGTKMWMANIIQ